MDVMGNGAENIMVPASASVVESGRTMSDGDGIDSIRSIRRATLS